MWQHTVAQDTLCNCAALASVMDVLGRAQDDWVDDGPMDRWTDGPRKGEIAGFIDQLKFGWYHEYHASFMILSYSFY
jgi:hypothetical protein